MRKSKAAKKEFLQQLEAICKAEGHETVAKKVGVHTSTVRCWLSGKYNPSKESIQDVCSTFPKLRELADKVPFRRSTKPSGIGLGDEFARELGLICECVGAEDMTEILEMPWEELKGLMDGNTPTEDQLKKICDASEDFEKFRGKFLVHRKTGSKTNQEPSQLEFSSYPWDPKSVKELQAQVNAEKDELQVTNYDAEEEARQQHIDKQSELLAAEHRGAQDEFYRIVALLEECAAIHMNLEQAIFSVKKSVK